MRVLDIGCGPKMDWPPRLPRQESNPQVIGLDISFAACRQASIASNGARRPCICARAEQLPLAGSSIDLVISSVAVPYTDIPLVLAEVRRVLVSGGRLNLSLHDIGFTLQEIRTTAVRRPAALLYRLLVLCSGLWFFLTGRSLRVGNRVESWQSERGMRLALERAGFTNIRFSHLDGRRFVVEASLATPEARLAA